MYLVGIFESIICLLFWFKSCISCFFNFIKLFGGVYRGEFLLGYVFFLGFFVCIVLLVVEMVDLFLLFINFLDIGFFNCLGVVMCGLWKFGFNFGFWGCIWFVIMYGWCL